MRAWLRSSGRPSPLKPLVAADVWCLQAQVFINGTPASYFVPSADFSGYVVSGTLPAGAIASVRNDASGAPPRVS